MFPVFLKHLDGPGDDLAELDDQYGQGDRDQEDEGGGEEEEDELEEGGVEEGVDPEGEVVGVPGPPALPGHHHHPPGVRGEAHAHTQPMPGKDFLETWLKGAILLKLSFWYLMVIGIFCK